MDKLRVRVYNVRFGDGFLITVPDKGADGKTVTRHILIDVGNSYNKEGGDDSVFEPVVDNVLQEIGNAPLDLYIMTHEHMDHVQGLLHVASKTNKHLKVNYSWLTASAKEDYYDTHPAAKEKHLKARELYLSMARFLKAAPEHDHPFIKSVMNINNPRKTDDCVTYLRKLAEHTSYIHRESDLFGTHPFNEVQFKIWAPEEDTSQYYGRFYPMALNISVGGGRRGNVVHEIPTPPNGVDAGAFYRLVEARRRGVMDNLLAIDKAANNTSIVFSLQWRGWKLLFTGDAEHRSWETIRKMEKKENKEIMEAVHFFKVSHHGSHTGVPGDEILDKILPLEPQDQRPRQAVVSTYPETYSGIPDTNLLEEKFGSRCQLHYMNKGVVGDGEYFDLFFEGE